MVLHALSRPVTPFSTLSRRGLRLSMHLHENRPTKRAGEAGKALRAGGGADFIFSASERVVKALSLPVEALVCLRGVLCCGERVRA